MGHKVPMAAVLPGRHALPRVAVQAPLHKLVDMAIRVETTRTFMEDLAWRVQHGAGDPKVLVAQLSMLKVQSMQTPCA